jgi:hypothetical protein
MAGIKILCYVDDSDKFVERLRCLLSSLDELVSLSR